MRITSENIGDLFVNLFMCLIGLMIVVSTAYKIYDYLHFKRQSLETKGVVTDIGCSGYFGCKPFVTYVDTQNQVYEFRSKLNYYFFAHPKKEEKVQILFLVSDHQKAIVSDLYYNIIQPLYFLLFGLFIVVVIFFRTVNYILPTARWRKLLRI